MEFAFYICGLIAILATLRVVTHTNPVHALLYLIISLLAIAGVFFSLGAHRAAALPVQLRRRAGPDLVAARVRLAHHRVAAVLVGLESFQRVDDEQQLHGRGSMGLARER